MRPFAPRLRLAAPLALTLAVSSAVLTVAPARASLVLALDLPQMVERADHVAVVDVQSVQAAWDAKHERILTTVDLAVVESWKGPMAPAMHVKVVQPSGTVGDVTMKVFGLTQFTPGERALVFLRGAQTGAAVVGMAQGKRLLRRDVTTKRWMVLAPDRSGAMFVPPKATTSAAPVFDPRQRPLDDLRVEIRDLVGKASGR
jgi:hypothetical protein